MEIFHVDFGGRVWGDAVEALEFYSSFKSFVAYVLLFKF